LNPSATYQKVCADGVQIFTSVERIPSDYVEIALLNSKGESGWTDERQMLTSQRNKAGSLGANGIVLQGTSEPKAGTKIIGALLGTGAERKGSALAIYIPADSARVRLACGTDEARLASAQSMQPQVVQVPSQPMTEVNAPPRAHTAAPAVAPATVAAEEGDWMQGAWTGVSPNGLAQADRAGPETVPVGTRFIGHSSTKHYFSIDCPVVDTIGVELRYFFRSEAGAQAMGYRRGQC
jgi:hypothetical protein